MKCTIRKYIHEEVELTFKKWVEVPMWCFAYANCDKCDKEFDSLSEDESVLEDTTVIRARDDQTDNYWTFCKECFRGELLH